MSFKQEAAKDFAEIISDIGEPITWNGREFKAIITAISEIESLAIGGFAEEYDFTVKIPSSYFYDSLPQTNDRVTMDGISYRIVKVMKSKKYPALVFTIKSK